MFGCQHTKLLNLALPILFYKEEVFSKMFTGGKKIQKPNKTKFHKNRDKEEYKFEKKKHHDKTLYRLAREERKEYVV